MVRFPAIPAALCLAAALAGCAPDLGPAAKLRTPASLASAQALPDQAGTWPADGWWRAYGDPQLDRLIEEGLAGSPDVATAAARVARAVGEARQAGAALGPAAGISASGGGAKQSYHNGFPEEYVPHGIRSTGNVYLQAGIDLDLFGKNRATRRGALAQVDAARLDAAEARLALSTSIAAAYADLARLYGERDIIEQTLRNQGDSARLVGQRVASGLDTEGERAQAQALVPASNVDLAATDEAIVATRHQLAALIGAGPDRGMAIERPRLGALTPQLLPANAGIALVGRRPDIAAARARAEAASQRVRAAHADFYPDLTLSGLVGLQALGISHLVNTGSSYGNGGPALTLPLFDTGQRNGQYRVARADYDLAVADYDRTLIGALREVADTIASRDVLTAQSRDAAASLAQSETAYRIARLRYEGGLASYLSVLTAEQGVIAARRRNVDIAARAVTLDVTLVRALGGGFTSASQD